MWYDLLIRCCFWSKKLLEKYDKSTAKPTQHNNIIKQFRINNTMDKLCYCYTLLQMENQPFVDDFPWFSHAFSTSMQTFTLGYMMEWMGIHAYIYICVCVCVYICIKANGWYKYTNIEPLVSHRVAFKYIPKRRDRPLSLLSWLVTWGTVTMVYGDITMKL